MAAAVIEVEKLAGVPDGYDAFVLGQLAAEATASAGKPTAILHVARDDRRLVELEAGLAFFMPQVKTISFPAWDTVPYDRVGPNSEVVAKRITSLARLALVARKEPTVVLTTVNAVLQRVPPREFLRRSMKPLAPGQRVDMKELVERLRLAGYIRTGTVMEPGEYAVRGGIVDLFPPGRTTPVRLDFFGDNLESIKGFDPQTQRTAKPVQRLALLPVSELAFGEASERLFRQRYVEMFGAVTGDDPIYAAVTAGQRAQGLEHWLPLFHVQLETLFDYLPDAPISFDAMAEQAIESRIDQIREHYQARLDARESQAFGAPPYKPVPPDSNVPAGQRVAATSVDAHAAASSRRSRQRRRPRGIHGRSGASSDALFLPSEMRKMSACSMPSSVTSRRCRSAASASSWRPGRSVRASG